MYLMINDILKQDIVGFEESLLPRIIDEEQYVVLELTISIGNFNKDYYLTSQILKDLSSYILEEGSIFKLSIYNDENKLIYETTEYTSLQDAVIRNQFDDESTGNLFFRKILFKKGV